MDKIAVLVAEDNPEYLSLLEIELEMKGYQVVKVTDGKEAIERLKWFRPNLILTDVMMPNIDGIELIHHVRNTPALSDVPIVVISAYERALADAIVEGATEAIRKPVDFESLEEVLDRYLPPSPNAVRRNH